MSNSELDFSKKTSTWPKIIISSLIFIVIIGVLMVNMSREEVQVSKDEVFIYCAAGIRLPIKEISDRYTKEFGVKIHLEYSSSGELESKLQQDAKLGKSRAHLYIPADLSFAHRTREKGLTVEQFGVFQQESAIS